MPNPTILTPSLDEAGLTTVTLTGDCTLVYSREGVFLSIPSNRCTRKAAIHLCARILATIDLDRDELAAVLHAIGYFYQRERPE